MIKTDIDAESQLALEWFAAMYIRCCSVLLSTRIALHPNYFQRFAMHVRM